MQTIFISINSNGATYGPSIAEAITPADILTSTPSQGQLTIKLEHNPAFNSLATRLTINGEDFGAHTQPHDLAYWIARASSSVNPQRMREFITQHTLLANGWVEA